MNDEDVYDDGYGDGYGDADDDVGDDDNGADDEDDDDNDDDANGEEDDDDADDDYDDDVDDDYDSVDVADNDEMFIYGFTLTDRVGAHANFFVNDRRGCASDCILAVALGHVLFTVTKAIYE